MELWPMVKGLKLPTNIPVFIAQLIEEIGFHNVATIRITSEVLVC